VFTNLNNDQIEDLHDENYTSFVVSLLVQKLGEGRGALIRGGAYFKFLPIGGSLFEGGAYSRGGANSKIYGIYLIIFFLFYFVGGP